MRRSVLSKLILCIPERILTPSQFPQLEKLEDEHISIIKERADMIAQRRKAEDEDDLALFFGTPPQLQPKPDEVDDLGRVIPSANPAASRADRTAARAARRLHRRAANQQRTVEEEGYSTDGELPPADADDYRVAMGKLVADAQAIMADVKAEEFRDASAGVGKWFGEWRAKFDEVYRGAWGGLGMVSAWEFWARLEILGWNPLEVSLEFGPAVRCMHVSMTIAHVARSAPAVSTHSAGTARFTNIRARRSAKMRTTKTSPNLGRTATSSLQ